MTHRQFIDSADEAHTNYACVMMSKDEQVQTSVNKLLKNADRQQKCGKSTACFSQMYIISYIIRKLIKLCICNFLN